MAVLLVPPYQYFTDDDGNPLSGGKVYTYQAGTTNPKAVYSAEDGLTPLTNPVILDSAGRTLMFGLGSYKFVVTDANDVVIRTTDNVATYSTSSGSANPFFQSFSGNGSQTSFTLTDDLGTDEKTILVYVNNDARPFVTNGSFATDTDWTKGAGWTIGAGVAAATGAISTAISQTAPVTLVAGRAYSVTYTITRSAGGLIPSLGGQNGTERTASGTYREIIIAGSTQAVAFTGNAFTGTLDDIQITVADGSGFQIQNVNQYTLSGTNLSFTTAPAAGTNNIMVFAPSLSVGVAQAAAAAADASATSAANSAATATTQAGIATSAAATATAAAYFGTSTTSVTIGTGAKSFTTQTGKNFQVGGFLLISSQADGANYMHGQVTSYDSGTGALVMDITNIGGSGTLNDWNIYVSGTRGATGAAGGPLVDGDYGDVTVSGSGTVITVDGSSATDFLTNSVRTSGSSGVAIKNSAGTAVLTVGSAASTNSSFAGALNVTGQTNFTGNAVMANDGRFSFGAGTVYTTGNATSGTLDIFTASTQRARVDVDGFLFLNSTGTQPSSTVAGLRLSPSPVSGASLSSGGNVTTSQNHFIFINGNSTVGSIATNGTATAYNTSSDYRLKQNVVEIPNPIERLKALKPREYAFKSQPQYKYTGFIAHELKEVCYEAVTGYKDQVDQDGNPIYQGVDHSKLVPILTAALQNAIARIELLEAAALRGQL